MGRLIQRHSCGRSFGIASFESLIRKPQSLNPFVYTEENPINFVDPFGFVCGSGWNDPLVPDEKPGGYSFVKPCSNHDKCYRSCGRSKVECDNIFFNDMKEVCQNLNGLWYYDCISTAKLYYYAVTIFGGPAYNKAQKHCRCEESW